MVQTQKCFSTYHHQCFTITKNECSSNSQSDCYIENVKECSTSYKPSPERSCKFSYANTCLPDYNKGQYGLYASYMRKNKIYESSFPIDTNFPSKNSTCKMLRRYACSVVDRQTPKTSCKYVPRQYCNSNPKSQCKPVYKQQCISVPSTKCISIPIEECKPDVEDGTTIENGNRM